MLKIHNFPWMCLPQLGEGGWGGGGGWAGNRERERKREREGEEEGEDISKGHRSQDERIHDPSVKMEKWSQTEAREPG